MMLFPACIDFHSKLRDPNDGIDGCVEPSKFILPKVVEASSFTLPPPTSFNITTSYILECSLLYAHAPFVSVVPTARRESAPMLYISCYYIHLLVYDQAAAD